MAGLNGNTKWIAGVIITCLLCVLTFLGGRESTTSAIDLNRDNIVAISSDVSVLEERSINQEKYNLRFEAKLDEITELLNRLARQ